VAVPPRVHGCVCRVAPAFWRYDLFRPAWVCKFIRGPSYSYVIRHSRFLDLPIAGFLGQVLRPEGLGAACLAGGRLIRRSIASVRTCSPRCATAAPSAADRVGAACRWISPSGAGSETPCSRIASSVIFRRSKVSTRWNRQPHVVELMGQSKSLQMVCAENSLLRERVSPPADRWRSRLRTARSGPARVALR
jgi:hypothetical protein